MTLDPKAEEEIWVRLRMGETEGAVIKTRVDSMEKKVDNLDSKIDRVVWKFFAWITGIMVLVNGLTAMWIRSGIRTPH